LTPTVLDTNLHADGGTQLKKHVEFFDSFTERVLMSTVKEELRAIRRDPAHKVLLDELKKHEKGKTLLSPDFDQKSLSIAEEIGLLREVKDAKEELLIIRRILEQQDAVIEKGFRSILKSAKDVRSRQYKAIQVFNCASNDKSLSRAPSKGEKGSDKGKENHEKNTDMIYRTIQNSMRAVLSMLERADEAADGVSLDPSPLHHSKLIFKLKILLDLKQKEANVQEARTSRELAQDNERQSKVTGADCQSKSHSNRLRI
jgi:hypothetical protein